MRSMEKTSAIEAIYSTIVRESIKQICITSLTKDSGNTTLCHTLATRAAQAGKHVLLIEFNLENPSLGKFETIIQNQWLPLTGHWEQAVQDSQTPGLNLLCAPNETGNCFEFRDIEIMALFFETAMTQYDLIICDVSPLLCQEASIIPTEALSFTSQHTFLNVLTNVTTESQLTEAKEMLEQSGASISAVIMNDRFAPSLKDELIRETQRLNRLFPRTMNFFRRVLNRSLLLNQDL